MQTALEKAGVEFIPEDELKETRGPPKREHTVKGPAQTQFIGLEFMPKASARKGEWQTLCCFSELCFRADPDQGEPVCRTENDYMRAESAAP